VANDLKRILVPHRAVRRLRLSEGAQARGYVRLTLDSASTNAQDCLVPTGQALEIFLRAGKVGATVSLDAKDGTVEPIEWGEAALIRFRRRFTRLKQGVLDFESLETFAAGPKKETKSYRKQVRYVRRFKIAPGGQFIRKHPELVTGWPAAESERSTLGTVSNAKVAVALHLYYVDLWPEIEMLLTRWSVPFTLLLTLTRENVELTDRVQSVFPAA